jgi:hypothetical protein
MVLIVNNQAHLRYPFPSESMFGKNTSMHILSHLFIHMFGTISKWCN